MPTKDVYFFRNLKTKQLHTVEKYGLNYDTNLCKQLSQHSIRAFIPIRKHENEPSMPASENKGAE